ncbi:hypothetical protein [Tunturiibacter empetritectus]|uniref:hypothetical protein n=1 Tax=Tunturiibacter empetritectus TaxID=3069691 RepID=UPI003D9AFF75
MNRQVFYDPQRKRWKRLRRIFDVLALLGLVLGTIFVIGLMRMKPLPELFLRAQKRNYRALANQTTPQLKPGQKLHRSAHRKTDVKPGDVPLNSGEGLRAAYYVEDDPASLLFAEAAYCPGGPAVSGVAACGQHDGRGGLLYAG